MHCPTALRNWWLEKTFVDLMWGINSTSHGEKAGLSNYCSYTYSRTVACIITQQINFMHPCSRTVSEILLHDTRQIHSLYTALVILDASSQCHLPWFFQCEQYGLLNPLLSPMSASYLRSLIISPIFRLLFCLLLVSLKYIHVSLSVIMPQRWFRTLPLNMVRRYDFFQHTLLLLWNQQVKCPKIAHLPVSYYFSLKMKYNWKTYYDRCKS